MRSWQWPALVAGPVLIGVIVLFPYTSYFHRDVRRGTPRQTEDPKVVSIPISLGSWRQTFVPVWEVEDLRDQVPPMRSGGNVQVNWLVVLLLLGVVVLAAGLLLGYRRQGFAGRREVLFEAWGGFAALASAALALVVVIFPVTMGEAGLPTWKRAGFGIAGIVLLLGSVAFLWRAATASRGGTPMMCNKP